MDSAAALCLNSGSSTLKFALFALEPSERRLAHGAIEGGRAWIEGLGERRERTTTSADPATAFDAVVALLDEAGAPPLGVVGHRVVHGGPQHVAPALADAALVASLRSIVPLAPLHLPAAIAGIEAVRARHPALPQVACFDTAFHATLPEVARRLPLPSRFNEVRRYGFHGLSYEYVMSTLAPDPPARIIIAHLGNGSSLVAVKDGRAIDTTMGFTPCGGVMMGTRSGDMDPGALIYLARARGLSVDALEHVVNHEAGLLGVAGISDMRSLLERSDAESRLALAMFGYSVRKAIGGFVAALGGIDLLVFTGGIGENAPAVRTEACAGLEAFGIVLDPSKNEHAQGTAAISGSASRCTVKVIPTDEDLVIARHVRAFMVAESET